MRRVMIVGLPGAGKSWLARRVAARTGLPIVHVDMIHWAPGWQERAREDKIALARAAEKREAWIIEGMLPATWDTRLARADTLIVLDLPLWRRGWRVARRSLHHYGRTRPDMPEDCPERFDPVFWRYVWASRSRGRDQLFRLMKRAGPGTRCYLLDSPRVVNRFLNGIESAPRPA